MGGLDKSRLDKDMYALVMVREIMVKYAIDILNKNGVLKYLNAPGDLNKIMEIFKINNKGMLENILDILVGYGVLGYSEHKYYLKDIPDIDIKNAETFLNNNYKESLEWINFVNQYSENTLMSGKPSELTNFEEEKSVYYWNKIMEQSPYSLRVIAITELYRDLKPNSLILDYGCGSGVGLEQLIDLSNIPMHFVGVDPSKRFFSEAKNRINNLHFEDDIRKKNINSTIFEEFYNLDKYVDRFDRIFISIIFNHIHQGDHLEIFHKLHTLLKKGGKIAIVQLLDFDKFNRNPIWVMHNIPSHKGYPLKNKFIDDLKSTFGKVDVMLDGMVTISTK